MSLDTLRDKLKIVSRQLLVFSKWIACSGILGVTVGGVATLFHYSIDYATGFREAHGWILWLLPAAGVAIALLYKLCGMENDRGTNLVLMSIRSTEKISILMAPLIFFSTVVTHFCGGSAGREGGAMQIGGSVGAALGRLLRMDDKDERIMIMCGMSAAFSALFGTPVAAAVFSMEVISVGIMHYAAIIPCVLSAAIGYGLAGACGVVPERYVLAGIPRLSAPALGRVVLLAALCAIVSTVFCLLIQSAGRLYRRYLTNTMVRAAVGGALVIALTFLFGSRDYNGAGMGIIADALGGNAYPAAFALKILLTAVTLGAGFKGGEIVPAFFVGATFGSTMGGMLGLHPSFAAGIGVVALFCGVTNCPLTSILISVELFGADGLLMFAVTSAVSYMLSGYTGLYSEQKIMYSKFRPEFIDKKVG